MSQMFEAQTMDFPFVGELPKRERSKVETLWDRFHRLKAITDEKGMLLPPLFCAKLLGVSRQRIYVLLDEGRLERIDIDGHTFVTEASFIEWCRAEHKSGRPTRLESATFKDCLKLGSEMAKAK